MQLHTIGIDLGKTVFHLVGLNPRGEVVVRKKFSRKQLLVFTGNLQVQLIGMEACGGSHFLGRALREQGHEVRLMPAQDVKPYVKTNKSDYIDAEAIAEALEQVLKYGPQIAWLAQLTTRAHNNVVAVALANKLARTAQRGIDLDRRAFPRVIVHDGQHPNHLPAAHAILHEIH